MLNKAPERFPILQRSFCVFETGIGGLSISVTGRIESFRGILDSLGVGVEELQQITEIVLDTVEWELLASLGRIFFSVKKLMRSFLG